MENQLGSCSSSLRQRKRIKNKAEPPFIPDEIITDILLRLPAKDVLRSRCVCRKWRDLTSTSDFTDMHLRASFPMFLKNTNPMVMVDRCWEPAQTRSKIHKVYQPFGSRMLFPYNGLISARGDKGEFVIYNPIYRDTVNIILPKTTYWSELYGVFFNPVQKEYCTLWQVTLSLVPRKIQYKILNLESNPKWRDIKNPCPQNYRISIIPLVLIGNYLYSFLEPFQHFGQICDFNDSSYNCNIMKFDIRKERFRMIPCPVPIIFKRYNYNVNLVDIDGVVSLVQVFPSKEAAGISIWTLKDDDEEHPWTCSNYILSPDVYPEHGVPMPLAFRDGELVLRSNGRLYVCNIKLGTFKKFGSRYSYYRPLPVSLVSLKNWKSKICLDVEDDVNNHRDQPRWGDSSTKIA